MRPLTVPLDKLNMTRMGVHSSGVSADKIVEWASHTFDDGLGSAFPDLPQRCSLTGEQGQPAQKNRLAGPGLTGQGRQPGAGLDHDLVDQSEVADSQV